MSQEPSQKETPEEKFLEILKAAYRKDGVYLSETSPIEQLVLDKLEVQFAKPGESTIEDVQNVFDAVMAQRSGEFWKMTEKDLKALKPINARDKEKLALITDNKNEIEYPSIRKMAEEAGLKSKPQGRSK